MKLYFILALLVSLIIAVFIYKCSSKTGYTTEKYSASDGNLMVSDLYGNITLTPNILNDLQTKAQAQTQANQITNLTNQINTLSTQLNNIINGTTPIQNLNVNGVLTVNSSDARPIRMNKVSTTDKTGLISYQLNGNEYNAFGVGSNGQSWDNGNGKGWW